MKKLCLILILLNSPKLYLFCQGPEYNFEHLSLKQGLIDQTINWIMQDHTGFIWIGGEHGLTRHDGYDFTFYSNLPNCQDCPPLNRVFVIEEDTIGLLWIASDSGIWLYDPEKERSMLLHSFVSDTTNWYFGTDRKMILDSKGNIWATDPHGLVKFSCNYTESKSKIKDLIYTHGIKGIYKMESILPFQELEPGNTIQVLYEDQSRNIWVGCNEGLYVLSSGTNEFIRLDKGANEGTLKSIHHINSILEIHKNEYWILVNNGLYIMSIDNLSLSDPIRNDSLIHFAFIKNEDRQWSVFMMSDRQKNILTGTDKGIYKLNKDSRTGDIEFELLQNSYTDPEEIASTNSVVDIFEDRSGVLWAAYANGGIGRFNLHQAQFTSYKKLINSNFNNPDINSILSDSHGNLWIGCWAGGLYKINLENYKVTRFDLGFQKNDVVCMKEVSQGFFWIGSFYGIFTFNSLNGKIADPLPDSKEAKILRKSMIWDLIRDGDLIYIGASSGLFIYNLSNKQLYSYEVRDFPYSSYCWSFIKSRNGEIWVSTFEYGINKIEFNPQNGVITLKSIVAAKVLTENDINLGQRHRIYEDVKGNIWITDKFGLHQVNINTTKIKNFKLFENIEFPDAWSITEDNHNNLWIGTRVGLCRFNIETERVIVFDKEDGLPISFHGINSVYKEKTGKLYFGGIGGFYSFQPDNLKSNDSIPPVVITDFRLFNRSIKVDTSSSSILRKNISYTNTIQLRYNQNDLSFQFAALDYTQPLKNKYSFTLEGFQNEWVETDAKNRIANYTNLDPGTYTFRVKGSNNDGVWNEKGASLVIIIHKPWWGTILAGIIYVVVFVGVTGGLIYRRLWKLKKEKLVLENQVSERTQQIEEQKERILIQRDKLEEQNQRITELDELKSRFFTNISHEFRTPLSLILSPVEELLDDPRRNEKDRRKLNLVQRNTQRLLNLVNQLLDISKIDGSKMKLDLVEADVMKHLSAVAGSFSSLAETKSIHFHLHFPKEELKTWFDPDKLDKIVINLLSNAFKFTPEGGEVTISAYYKSSEDPKISHILEILVIDTGTGIPAGSLEKVFDRFYQVESSLKKEGGGTGIGLSLAREMARLMHGDITIKSENCQGSTFNFQFPLGKDHLNVSEFVLLKSLPETVAFLPYLFEKTEDSKTKQELKFTDRNLVLLIVEDNRDIRIQIAENFDRDYIIYEAIDGVSGLKKARDLIPDLIITDLMMPRLDGIELCEKLKNEERTSHIPIIMLTAKVTIEDKISGLQTGADDYISKPFNMVELKTRVKNLIEQRIKLRERFSREVTLEPHDISITPLDEKFLKKAIEIVEKHINDEEFDLVVLRKEMNMSRSTLFRKLHALTGQSPTEFIRTLRLKRAASLLKQNFGNVTQVSLEVGFNNLSYFNRSFKKLFGVSPVEYTKTI
jgi:signal transduction histidine kinase/ligand-binding sensor domain-containing protein/DNA-binding response OmpR family regulator